jgi:hypothetical protein
VPFDARGKHVLQITFDMGPAGGKIVGTKELEVGK